MTLCGKNMPPPRAELATQLAAKGLLFDKRVMRHKGLFFFRVAPAFYLGRFEKCATEPLWNAGAQWVNTSVMSIS